jgi:Carboxypeptidase regulatory-like domain
MADGTFTTDFVSLEAINMKRIYLFIAVVGLTSILQIRPVLGSDITGTVTLQGTPPPEKEITPLENDPTCGKLHTGKVFTHFYEVGPNHGLADVIVMLKGIAAQSTGASAPPAVLDQKGCLYHPQILAIQTNQKLVVRNSDPLLHNVHVTPTVPGNTEENQAQMAGAPDLTFTFPAPENFMRIKCDVHPWMFAWVTIVDNPYFAVTDKDGKYTIKDVPPGKYTLSALHYKLAHNGVDKEVEVKAGAPATVDFTLEVK